MRLERRVKLLTIAVGLPALASAAFWLQNLAVVAGECVRVVFLAALFLGGSFGCLAAARWRARVTPKVSVLVAGLGAGSVAIALGFLCISLASASGLQGALLLTNGGGNHLSTVLWAVPLCFIPAVVLGAGLPLVVSVSTWERHCAGRVCARILATYAVATAVGMCFVLASLSRFGVPGSLIALGVTSCLLTVGIAHYGGWSAVSGQLGHGGKGGVLLLWVELVGCGVIGAVIWAILGLCLRVTVLLQGSSSITTGITVALFAACVGLGCAAGGRLSDIFPRPRLVALLLMALVVTLVFSAGAPQRAIVVSGLVVEGMHRSALGAMFARMLCPLVTGAIPAFFVGAVLVSLTRVRRERCDRTSIAVAQVLSAMMLGAAMCAVLASHPPCGGQDLLHKFIILGLAATLIAFLYAAFTPGKWPARLGSIACCLIPVLAAPRVLAHWDVQTVLMAPCIAGWSLSGGQPERVEDRRSMERLVAVEQTPQGPVSVLLRNNEELHVCREGVSESNSSDDRLTLERLTGHLPLMLRPRAEAVLTIGLRTGVTLDAVSSHAPEEWHALVEPGEAIVAAETWGAQNRNVLKRVALERGAASQHLYSVKAEYDAVILVPGSLLVDDISRMYTREYLTLCKGALRTGGVIAAALPVEDLSLQQVQLVVRTFLSVFPNTYVCLAGRNAIMVGVAGETPLIEPDAIPAEVSPEVAASLALCGFQNMSSVLGLIVIDAENSVGLRTDGSIHSLLSPEMDRLSLRTFFSFAPISTYEWLLKNVTAFPEAAMAALGAPVADDVQRNQHATIATLQATVLQYNGALQRAVELAQQAHRDVPTNPIVRRRLVSALMWNADLMRLGGQEAQAFAQYQIALHYDPLNFWALYRLVNIAMRAERYDAGRDFALQGRRAFPNSPLFVAQRGKVRGTLGDVKGACEDLRAATFALPGALDLWKDYVVFLELHNDVAELQRARDKVTQLESGR